ncbi:Dot/Icm T4SS effector VpdC [Legionella hackeliae]|uniref:Protein with patatin domain n=1 Tax=Legionella hackeliae TaxID=449 RepID=A0A0A8UPV7_LEGHA|nr:Dot/Icm T4SS effector VpdC [Legionella hackeliae]KTD09767.1 esterase of the alpha-beta hydrolase superfamily protein [Legionella hackeliae]CEK10905.1 protein with patatin domain [Legionella hackeliae]STX47643.1 esterase of the alpha-beta hydrolase superfamily [Legionella hackeliae]
MSREEVLSALLRKDMLHPNILLLKKFLLTVYHGWFRINGFSPDEKYSLSEYLLDDERLIIDFTRLNEKAREKFLKWFLAPHSSQANQALLSGVATNNYRGYTAEVGLSRWGRIINFLFHRKKSYHWDFPPQESPSNNHLKGLELCQDTLGLLIGLNQSFVENNGTKYHAINDNQSKPLRNTKRVLLTDDMVNKLITTDLDSFDFDSAISRPHPFSINVTLESKRLLAMQEYRKTQRLFREKAWFKRLWDWIHSFFVNPPQEIEMTEIRSGSKKYRLLFSEGEVQVFKRENDGQIFVTEKRPELDSMVFCGGGAKIFAHVGALKAFEEHGIKPVKYAGSSAGAIMAALAYLGCSSTEILTFFQWFKQDNLIHYEVDSSGLSDARAMKAALDYMVMKKVNEIIQKYGVDKTPEGQKFLADKVFKDGKITFESLHFLKKRYPDCCLGEKLTVTATDVKNRTTSYFSYATSPHMELSNAVKISASFPVVFKPTVVAGVRYKDGGILSNLPTEIFIGDLSTLLESEHGNCLSMVAFQFDNGYERNLLDKFAERVYRENFFWNWLYSLFTGVKDPVSGWERDRLKLLQHSNQVVLIPVGNVSSTQFDLDKDSQNTLVDNGYQAGKNYITARYKLNDKTAKNDELMYSNFSSIEELLYFSCYRGHADWFEKLAVEAEKEGVSREKIHQLRNSYFSSSKEEEKPLRASNANSSSLDSLGGFLGAQWMTRRNMQLFESIYPIFHKLPYNFLTNTQDLKFFKLARHSLSLDRPLEGLKYLKQIKGETHVLLSIFIQILSTAQLGKIDETISKFKLLMVSLQDANMEKLKHSSFYGKWNLLVRQSCRILKLFEQQNWADNYDLCASLKEGEEPLQTLAIKDAPVLDNRVNDEYSINNENYEVSQQCLNS